MEKDTLVVDDHDRVIGTKPRNKLAPADIYRVAALWVTNTRGDILLAKRQLSKQHDPGKWGPAVAGTVEVGQTYRKNILREAEEELGLRDIRPTRGPKTETLGQYHHITQWFLLVVDQPVDDFMLAEDEVEQVAWFAPEELRIQLGNHPDEFLPNLPKYLSSFAPVI